MVDRGGTSSGWESFEVCERDGDGKVCVATPVSDTLGASGTLPTQALTKMRMIEELGWPEARRCLKDDYGHPLIVAKDDLI